MFLDTHDMVPQNTTVTPPNVSHSVKIDEDHEVNKMTLQ